MARDQAKKTSDSRGKKKAERHSVRTSQNKQRAAETRARRLEAAERRRSSEVWKDPSNGRMRRKGLFARLTSRREQQARVEKKREQRRNFSKLSAKWKDAHRSAGASHTKPVDLI